MPVSAKAVITERRGDVSVLQVLGTIDGLAALDFERAVFAELDAGRRQFIIDLERVTIITSAGLRVLLILRKRLAADGGLVLCGVSPKVKTLLEISGLLRQFASVGSRDDAVAHLAQVMARPADTPAVRPEPPRLVLARVIADLLGCGQAARPAGPAAPGLAARIAELVEKPGPGSS